MTPKQRQRSAEVTLRDEVEAYDRNQEEHHRTRSWQEELRNLLNQYGIPYDEKYVWD